MNALKIGNGNNEKMNKVTFYYGTKYVKSTKTLCICYTYVNLAEKYTSWQKINKTFFQKKLS